MAYTWTNGELITAAKLNQTGGGGFDAVIIVSYDEEENLIATVESGSFSDFYSKFEDGDHPSAQIILIDPDGGYVYFNVSNVFDDGDGGLFMQVYTLSVPSGTSSAAAYGYQIGWNSSGITVSE